MKPIIPVFFTINDGYAPYLAVALRSLIRNADPGCRYHIHVIYQDLSPENRENLSALETEYASVSFLQMHRGLRGNQAPLRLFHPDHLLPAVLGRDVPPV